MGAGPAGISGACALSQRFTSRLRIRTRRASGCRTFVQGPSFLFSSAYRVWLFGLNRDVPRA
jgi:hypothetical protein